MHIKNLPVLVFGAPCEPGLHIAPWMGENGELVLVAITSRRRLAAPPLEIPWGADSVALAEQLQRVLDEAETPKLRII